MKDKIIENLIKQEEQRQDEFIQLIASENYVSEDVEYAVGSKLTNKYAEGYPGKRYYSGCETVDEVENLAINRLKELFNVKFANVQPHSGSQANFAVLNALLKPGEKIMGLSLSSGGHLTHGHFVNVSGNVYESVKYDVSQETEELDYEEILSIALKEKPKLIICGYSAYPREIDFKKFREIADEVGAYLMADVAHIAGLIAAGLHSSPIEHAHVITSTTHKTLRGPRGGIIMTNDKEVAELVDKSVFPGTQGGPLMHVIAGKAVAFGEALSDEFKTYQECVINNAKTLSKKLTDDGVKIISGGTDNHLMLIDTKTSFGITGTRAEELLYKANIVVNKNTIPFDSEGPMVTSGIRIGTPAMTTKGFKTAEFERVAKILFEILSSNSDEKALSLKEEVKELLK